ncbi:hypothetical protein LB507_005551 [Fusarium sp. FIESC RH6]|nr:hypothetical protein LB507_005551 [Fusarium sp. FIESC RH6]
MEIATMHSGAYVGGRPTTGYILRFFHQTTSTRLSAFIIQSAHTTIHHGKDTFSQSLNEESGISTKTIKGPEGLKQLLKALDGLPTKPPSIYLDASFTNQKELLNLQLFVLPKNRLYVVDIKRLGTTALSDVGEEGNFQSLRLALEAKDITKVGFDIREMSRILFRQFNVSLGGMYDLQLMELASRAVGQPKKRLAGLQKCIDRDSPSTYTTRRLGTFPALWKTYRQKLGNPQKAFRLAAAREESQKRIEDSKRDTGHQNEKHLGPFVWWDAECREDTMTEWTETCMEEYRVGDMELNDDAEWVPTGNISTKLNLDFTRMYEQLLTMERRS